MSVGISTACFYPLETEKCLEKTAKLGAQTVEVFLNSECEHKNSFINKLCQTRDEYSLKIKSVHHDVSFAESYIFFSSYARRFSDGLERLKEFFDGMNKLGAEILVFHGAKPACIEEERCFERFGIMHELGRKYGVLLAQENVFKYNSESPDYMARMKNYLGGEFSAVLDLKQALLAGYSPFDFVDALGEAIVHLHISDFNEDSCCLPPGEGNFDFKLLFDKMNSLDYRGDYIIELYENSYTDEGQIARAKSKLEKLF